MEDNLDLNELEGLAKDTHADLQEKEKPKMRNNLRQDEDGKEGKTEEKKDEASTVSLAVDDAATMATT